MRIQFVMSRNAQRSYKLQSRRVGGGGGEGVEWGQDKN